jgi:Holliday junction resolvase
MNMDNYTLGRNFEENVAQILSLLGWNCKLSPGSRGLFDIKATKHRRKKLCLQVKYRRNNSTPDVDFDAMVTHSAVCGCTPILAFITKIGSMLSSTRYSRHPQCPFLIMNDKNELEGIQFGVHYILQLRNVKTKKFLDIGEL